MNSNNRLTSLVIVALVTVGVPGLGYWFYLEPLWSLDSAMDGLNLELDKAAKESKDRDSVRKRIFADHPRLEYWKEMSWPAAKDKLQERHANDLQSEYRQRLEAVMSKSGLKKPLVELTRSTLVQPTSAGAKQGPNKAMWQTTAFRVTGQGALKDVATVLEGIQRIPILHRVASLDIKKPEADRKNPTKDSVDMSLTLEAIAVVGADKRETLEPELKKMPVLLNPDRQHVSILTTNNPFVIPAPAVPAVRPTPPTVVETPPSKPSEDREDYLTSVKLTALSSYERGTRTGWVAYFYDQNTNGEQKIYSLGLGRNVEYQDQYGNEMLKSKIVLMNAREAVLLSEDGYYKVSVGQNLYPAPGRILNVEQYKELGLSDPPKRSKLPVRRDELD